MAGLPDENLIELLLHLKVHTRPLSYPTLILNLRQKTTPEQAKLILNSQPQVSYALMDLMVKINAVNMEVFQVLYPSPFLTLPEFIRLSIENSHLSGHPNLLRRPSRAPPQLFLMTLRTLSNSSNSSDTKDALPNTPVHPHIQTTRIGGTLNRNPYAG